MGRVSGAMVGAAVVGVLALTACSEKGQPVAQEQEQAGDSQSVKLAAKQVGNLGSVVTDQNGLTLYRFDKDKAKPPVSNCKDDCAVVWPPMTVNDLSEVKLANVDKSLVGVLERADGTKQLTLAGWALYRYKDDKKAGDAKGQGINGTWFAATPEGKKAQAKAKQAPAPAPAPEQNSGGDGGGYGY